MAPAVVGVVGAEQRHVGQVVAFTALPVPAAAVVLDLPQPGAAGAAVGQAAHGQSATAGPHAPPGLGELPLAVVVGDGAVVQDGGGHAHRLALPTAFGDPVVLRPQQVRVPDGFRTVREAADYEGGDRLQVQCGMPFVAQDHLAAQY